MRIAIINYPIKTPWLGTNKWITVPPEGYGGIQWVVKNIIDGLLALGNEVYLLGAPGSKSDHSSFHVIEVGEINDIISWLKENLDKYDIINNHSNKIDLSKTEISKLYVNTHHFTGVPINSINTIYLSKAQACAIRKDKSPIIRIPVNPDRYIFQETKENYFLFMGRVCAWKGTLEAAIFSNLLNKKLIIAGPCWEKDYAKEINNKFKHVVDFVGEIEGQYRLELFSKAKALLAFSQPVMGPWGNIWCEPGATVVSEASVSGTPVISSDNGCLKEITPFVGKIIPANQPLTKITASAVLQKLPSPNQVRENCIKEWGFRKISKEYLDLFKQVINGKSWN